MRLSIPSLRLRLVTVMGLAYIFVAATTLITGYTVQRQSLHGQLATRAKEDAAILAAGSVGFGTRISVGPLRTFVASLQQRSKGLSYAAVTDASGNIIASTRAGDIGHSLHGPFATRPITLFSKNGNVEGIAPVVQPGGTDLGLAVVRLAGASAALDLRNAMILEIVMQLLGLALFLLLSLVIAQYILGPLVTLSRAARALRRGELSARVPNRTETELTAVTEAFNDMAGALEQRIKYLSFLAETGSALPNTLRHGGDVHPILLDFCRQVGAQAAGLLPPDDGVAVWQVASPDQRYRTVAERVGRAAIEPGAVVEGPFALMAVPVLGGAVFVTAREAERPFTQEEQQVISNFAYQMGIAADNARLFAAQQEALQVKDQFLSIVSHELRTPLTTVKGYAQMLQRKLEGDADAVRFADNIDAQASRLGRLVDDLLDVTRFARGQFELTRQDTDINVLLRDIVSRFRMVAPEHEFRLDLHSPEIRGEWDRDRLEQVMNNLLSNAVKYSPDGGQITVDASRRDDDLVVLVRDQGLGIPPEDQARLFERFYRGSVDSLQIKGLGLGLYVTQRIVEAHGGVIDVSSGPDKGTEFRITLPLASVLQVASV